MDTFNLVQHITVPTHKMGHTLDIVATFNNNPSVTSINANEYEGVSHHYLVDFNLICSVEEKEYKTITYRNIRNIDHTKLYQDISMKKQAIGEVDSLKDKVEVYNEMLVKILDKHAPLKTKTVKLVPRSPWFDSEYRNLRSIRRKAEKQYKRSNLPEHLENYKSLRKQTTNLALSKKKEYFDSKLNEMKNSKTIYTVMNKLLDSKQERILPATYSDKELADSFMTYFQEKISKIRDNFKFNEEVVIPDLPESAKWTTNLSILEETTADEILQIVSTYGQRHRQRTQFLLHY